MTSFLKLYDHERQAEAQKFEDCGGKYKPIIQSYSDETTVHSYLSLVFMYSDFLHTANSHLSPR